MSESQPEPEQIESTTNSVDTSENNKISKPKISGKLFIGLGIFISFLILGGVLGYLTGRQDRVNYAYIIEATTINDQFVRGLVALEKGNCENSQIHFEYILQQNPEYPGAFEKLQESILVCSHTATPTIAPSPTPVPTANPVIPLPPNALSAT